MTIEKLCNNHRAIYKPTNTKFPFGNFDPLLHKIIKFEDFDLKRNVMPMEQLLSLLEGAEFSADRKHSDHFSIKVKIPIIFISNVAPDVDSPDPIIKAFFKRFCIVEANTPIEVVQSALDVHKLNDLKTRQPNDRMSFTDMLNVHKQTVKTPPPSEADPDEPGVSPSGENPVDPSHSVTDEEGGSAKEVAAVQGCSWDDFWDADDPSWLNLDKLGPQDKLKLINGLWDRDNGLKEDQEEMGACGGWSTPVDADGIEDVFRRCGEAPTTLHVSKGGGVISDGK